MNYSRKRQAIIRLLENTTAHPTAEDIYGDLKREYPKLSLATVYRNLNELAESGKIVAVRTDDERTHYDGNVRPHAHVACPVCGQVTDIFLKDEELEKIRDICPEGDFQLTYYSVCSRCRDKKTTNKGEF